MCDQRHLRRCDIVTQEEGKHRAGIRRETKWRILPGWLEGLFGVGHLRVLGRGSPEAIVDNFPTLSLEQVYGAITFYLANRPEMDGYLVETEKLWENARNNQPPLPAGLRERLERARREPSPKRA